MGFITDIKALISDDAKDAHLNRDGVIARVAELRKAGVSTAQLKEVGPIAAEANAAGQALATESAA